MTNLARRLSTGDAVVIGLGSMIGAGVFAVFAPAADVAGTALLIGLAIAAVVAFCNATASAQLAAQYPESGGTYVYGRERLGEWAGFLAGWTFVIGKTASCAAMALTAVTYLVPDAAARPVAVMAVVTLTVVNCFGITRTATLTRVIVTVVLAVLVLVVVAGLLAGPLPHPAHPTHDVGAYAVLQSAGLLFFAFAGYARIATLGEEVRDPARAIPRAIVVALGMTLVVYTVIAVTALWVLGPDALARSSAPLVDVATAGGADALAPIVRVGAGLAALGALLALIAGVGRTTLAMARTGDLPPVLAAVNPRHQVPHRAEITVAVVVCVLVVTVDLRAAIGFSSFGVLLYYLVANLAAFTQQQPNRRYPRVLQVIGAAGCVLLVATLPTSAIVAGSIVVAVGVGWRLATRSLRARRTG
ncbi:APC family permease [Williamsia sp. CHRR-6]|uniref:APC family permease n=1 Tax=Williamsia sp. CHRR-6 TaxID=2835871 RepID=UPI001BDB28BC|nr:APC family permease [Williamsia sp. CHRR-6]MBT0567272.1 APC family permease [Williamsia sp. CHRR-6]